MLGDRAAKLVPMPTLGGCDGVCTGCSLVEGCGGSAAAGQSEPASGVGSAAGATANTAASAATSTDEPAAR